MPSPLLRRQGAVGDEVPLHYGEPLREQRALAQGYAVVDCSHWGVVSITGPDRLMWLDSITSQVFVGIQADETREGLILDPQGRVEHRFLLRDDGETSWVLTEPGTVGPLVAWLERMRFRMDVTIQDESEAWAPVAWVGHIPPQALANYPRWRDPWPGVSTGGVAYSTTDRPGEGFELYIAQVPTASLSESLSESWAGVDALEALLIRAGRPTLRDVDEKTLPHELDWLRTAVHLEKGCYRGQETVAKVHNLGHPPRRAVLLHLDGSDAELPEAGATVTLGDKEVGRITRIARHFEWGPLAYAVIKRTVDTEATLGVSGPSGAVAASQEVLVSPEAGATRREALAARKAQA